MKHAVRALLAASFVCASAMASAQSGAGAYPAKPIKIVVCFPAGGGVDFMARVVAEHLQSAWSNAAVVENKAGAGCNIGAEYVYNSPPDGYTILAAAPAPFTVNKKLYNSLRYDPDKLEPVSIGAITPIVLTIPANFPPRTAQAFFDIARAKPGALNYASQGMGTSGHLISSMLELALKTKFAHVPYKGAAPAINDTAAGHVNFMFSDLGGVYPLSQAKKVFLLATTSEKRVPLIKDVPTMIELGFPDFIGDAWWAFAAPPGTPLAIRNKLASAIAEAVKLPKSQERLGAMGAIPLGNTPVEMAAIITRDKRRWTQVIDAAKIKID